MRLLPYLIVIGAAIAVVVWSLQRVRGRSAALEGEQRPALPADMAETAVLAYGNERGPGILRATASQVVFAADSGRVLVIERLEITGVTTTHELPDRHSAAQLLAISTGEDVHYFLVDHPEQWLHRLT